MLGPADILVALTLTFKKPQTARQFENAIDEMTRRLRKVEPRIAHLYVRPPPQKPGP